MAAMLEASGENVLEVIAEHVGALIDVDLVVVAVPHGNDEFRVTTVRGRARPSLQGRSSPRPARSRPARWPPGARRAPWARPTRPGRLAARIGPDGRDPPLQRRRAARRPHRLTAPGGPAFTDADLDMAFAFAGQASVAIEIVRAREDRRRLEPSRDRARIARDLHDHVIQRLFGAGLSLQAVSATVDADASAAIETQVDAIDAAIKDIRTVVFALGAGERGRTKRTRDRMLDVVTEVSAGLPRHPRITFAGPLDSLVPPPSPTSWSRCCASA